MITLVTLRRVALCIAVTGLAACATPSSTAPAVSLAPPPKLVVFMAVDGLPQRQIVDYRSQLAPDGLADSMGVFGLPSTFLIDTNGSIVDAHFGELSHDELLAKLQRYGFA